MEKGEQCIRSTHVFRLVLSEQLVGIEKSPMQGTLGSPQVLRTARRSFSLAENAAFKVFFQCGLNANGWMCFFRRVFRWRSF